MPIGDYLGADAKGRPMQCRTAQLAGRTIALSPLTTAEVIELHSELFDFQDIALTLIYYPECLGNHDEQRVFLAFGICVRILFPATWRDLIEAAAKAMTTPDANGRLRGEVAEILRFYQTQHDWKRIFGTKSLRDAGLLGIAGVKDGVVEYRKQGRGRLSFEASHLSAREAGAPDVFEMLQWRPEAYLSEFDAIRELQKERQKKSSDGVFSGTLQEFSERMFGWN